MSFYSRRIFPHLCEAALSSRRIRRLRAEALAPARGRVLEIGIGTGLNLPHYPPSVRRLDAVDPHPSMPERTLARARASGRTVQHRQLSAETLPYDSGSFDTAVSTFTLCSIPDLPAALAELRRVLRPDGRLLFVEHGLAPDPDLQRWQRRLTPLQKVLGDGCHLDRPIRAELERAGFAVEGREFFLPKTPRVAGYVYLGAARPA